VSAAVLLLALRPTARALPVRFAATGALVALGSVVVLRNAPSNALLLAGVFLAAAAAPVLDDRAAPTLDSSATSRWARRSVRLGLSLPALAGTWLLLLATSELLAPAGVEVPASRATWQWMGMLAVVLTISCVAIAATAPTFDGSAGVGGLLCVLLADLTVQRLWPKLGVFRLGEPAMSTQLQLRMTALVAVAILTLAVFSRDPAAAS